MVVYSDGVMTTVSYKCRNIEWDTDGDKLVFQGLPQTLDFRVPADVAENEDELQEFLSDALSEATGWCHFGFDYYRNATV